MKLVENFDIKQIERNVQDDLKDKDISKLIQDDGNKKKRDNVYRGTSNNEWNSTCRTSKRQSIQRSVV